MSAADTDRWIERAEGQREEDERRSRYDDAPGTPPPSPSYAEQERAFLAAIRAKRAASNQEDECPF